MRENLFVDCHCHLFNIVDIPLYATLQGKVEMGTLKRLIASFAVGGGMLFGFGENILEKNEEFIRFFERSIEDNIKWFYAQLKDVAEDKRIIITPLIMDFDKIHLTSTTLKEPSVVDQLKRLIEAINNTRNECPNLRIYPFIGYDCRKLENHNGLDEIQKIWNSYRIKTSEKLKSGDVLGIKLYPPIGFNPNPSDQHKKKKYLEFYKWCCNEGIPLTTHCQSATGSYSVGKRNREINKITHSKNWWYLFKENPEIHNLRINFAHFGGEDGVEDLIDWYGIDRDSWTYYLIRLLKHYPNTYSDISAYDFSDEKAIDNLVKIHEMDEDRKFEEENSSNYKLVDKFLWGSDIPMVISSNSYRQGGVKNGVAEYRHLYRKFKRTLLPIKKMTCSNPVEFLNLS